MLAGTDPCLNSMNEEHDNEDGNEDEADEREM